MRSGLLPKGYERIGCSGIEELTRQYHAGHCGAAELRGLLFNSSTWMYDSHLSELAQYAKSKGAPVETPDGSALFALYFRTAEDDILAFAFPRRTSGDDVRTYVKLKPEFGMESDAMHERGKNARLRSCEDQVEKLARLLSGSVRDYHEERG